MTTDPKLWASIEQALGDTDYFVVLLSPEAAQSEWVNKEIAWWLEHRDAASLLPVHTSGEWSWNGGAIGGSAVPPALVPAYDEEPRHLDLRWTKDDDGEATLDLANPRFKSSVADLAAKIHGTTKDEIVAEDLDQFRKSRRYRRAAVTGLAILTVAAVIGGVLALLNAQRAARNEQRALENEQRALDRAEIATSRALGADARQVVEVEPDLAALLALESLRTANTADARGALLTVLTTPTAFESRIATGIEPLAATALSDDLLALADADGSIGVFDGAGATVAEVTAGSRPADMAIDGDGRLLVAVNDPDARLLAFDATTGAPGPAVDLEWSGPADMLFSGDGGMVLALGAEEAAMLDAGGALVGEFDLQGATPLGIAVDHTGTQAAFEFGGQLILWDLASGEEWDVPLPADVLADLEFTDQVNMEFSRDGALLLLAPVVFPDNPLYVLELATGSTVAAEPAPEVETVTAEVTRDGDRATIATGHLDSSIQTWSLDLAAGTLERSAVWVGHAGPIGSVVSQAGGLASIGLDGEILRWAAAPSAATGLPIAANECECPVGRVAFAGPERRWIVSFDSSGYALVTDGAGELLARVPPGDDALDGFGMAVTRTGDRLAISNLNEILVFGLPGSELVATHAPGDADVASLDWDESGTRLAWADVAGRAGWIDAATGDVTDYSPEGEAEAEPVVAFGPATAPELLAVGLGPAVTVHDLAAGSARVFGPQAGGSSVHEAVLSLAFSPDGTRLASGDATRDIYVWDLAAEAAEAPPPLAGPLVGHRDEVHSLAFTPDGLELVSAALEETLRVWEISTGQFLALLPGHDGRVRAVAMRDDGTLISGGAGGEVRAWAMAPELWVEEACDLAGRNLTRAEWDRWVGADVDYVRHCAAFPGESDALAEYDFTPRA